MILDGLDDGLGAADLLEGGLLPTLRWTPPQYAWLSDPAEKTRAKLLRTGNQLGKTYAGLAEVLFRCSGSHPFYPVPSGPIEAWVICATHETSIIVQRKLWDLVPKEWLDPSVVFDPVRGFRGKHPVVRFANGSLIRFKTTRQGGLTLASATIDVVLIDELTVPRIYRELQKRLMRRNGMMLLTLTPVNAPAGWLRELVEAGDVIDHHYGLSEANLTPMRESNGCWVTGDRPLELTNGDPMDEAFCAAERRRAGGEAGVVCDGEWLVDVADRELRGFSGAVLYDDREELPAFVAYGLGGDHGEGAGREVAYLVGLDVQDRLWVLGEYSSPGTTTPIEDAAGIAGLVRSVGLGLECISRARFDTNSAGKLGGGQTINRHLYAALVAEHGGPLPWRIENPNKAAGTVKSRTWLLNSAMLSGRLRIHQSCSRLIEACRTWRGEERGRTKDPIDGLGYIADVFLRDVVQQPGRIRVDQGDGRGIRRR